MVLRVLLSSAALLLSSLLSFTLSAQGDVSGTWLLNGPGTESEILLTEEGLRIQSEYELLADDPSFYCTPASSSRIWANPGAPIKIELSDERVQITYELFDLRREIPVGDESVLSDMPSTRNLNGAYFSEMGSSFARYDGERLIIESRNHTLGYIRTSRGIPQSTNTVVTEELQVEDVLSVPAYNYGWQPHYHLSEPVSLGARESIHVTGAFDNSYSNPFNPDPDEEVTFGLESYDEMFTGYVTYFEND